MRRIGLDVAAFDSVDVGARADACRQVIGAVGLAWQAFLQEQVRLMIQLNLLHSSLSRVRQDKSASGGLFLKVRYKSEMLS